MRRYMLLVVPNTIDDDGVEIPPPSHEEFTIAIMSLKNYKTV